MAQSRSLRVAVVGCAHGELDKMYATIRHINQSESVKVDLLLCCGDFQAVRNESDLNSLACPEKFRSMNSFWKYYSGEETAPCPTVFIGGNHEASNYLLELFYGGWAAPNIFYLGAAGVIRFGGLRIGGLSGIYKRHDYNSGHFERPPFSESTKRSIYHVREYEVAKLMQLVEPMDIFMSHDWPRGVVHCGNVHSLLRYKSFLKQEIESDTLGSEPGNKLLTKLKPSYWFSAHLHVKYAAVVQHPDDGKVTKFLALDKCLPGRGFLQVLDFPVESDAPLEIMHDEEWLAITRAYHSAFPSQKNASTRPCSDLQTHRAWVKDKLAMDMSILTPPDFRRSAPVYNPREPGQIGTGQNLRSLQTEEFLNYLELPYLFGTDAQAPAARGVYTRHDPNEIMLNSDDENDLEVAHAQGALDPKDPNEIMLNSDDENQPKLKVAHAQVDGPQDANEIMLNSDDEVQLEKLDIAHAQVDGLNEIVPDENVHTNAAPVGDGDPNEILLADEDD